jgi:hypothetical protein
MAAPAVVAASLLLCAAAAIAGDGGLLNVVTRQQRQQFTGRHRWDVVEQTEQWPASSTAFVVVDMWNDHPCLSATFHIHGLAGPMEQVLSAARSAGVSIIHAPSGCGQSMAHLPARQYVLNLTNHPLPSTRPHADPQFPLVINGSQAQCGPPEMKSEMCGCDGTWRAGSSWPKTVYCPQLTALTVKDQRSALCLRGFPFGTPVDASGRCARCWACLSSTHPNQAGFFQRERASPERHTGESFGPRRPVRTQVAPAQAPEDSVRV